MAENERSLRQIAARVLNRDTEEGLEELDRIACGIDVAIRRRYITCATLFLLFGVLFAASIINCLGLMLSGGSVNDYDLLVVFLFGLGTLAPLLFWRSYQYGIGQVRNPKAPIYAGASKASIASLEKLFIYLQRKNAPQSYVRRRNGTRRDLNRRHYFGSLRGLLLAEDANVRSGCLPPHGFWLSQLIYIDADPDAIIKAINAKPKSGGRPKEIDYEAVALRLIEHPALKDIDPDKYGAETRVMELIRGVCEAGSVSQPDLRVPEDTELRKFAKKILAAMQKNRTTEK